MEIIQSIIIGGIQGISEFLPISSSGHLVLIPYIFKWNYNGLTFDVALHFGTAIALVAYFWKDWKSIIANAIINLKFKNQNSKLIENSKIKNENSRFKLEHVTESEEYPANLLWQILLASIPAAIIGFIFNDIIDKTFHSSSSLGMIVIALNLAVFGIILWLTDQYSKKTLLINQVSYKKSFLVGLTQALALIPGVSRSGITITTGLALGLKREDSARLSFLLSTPAMVGAFIYSIKDLSLNDINSVFVVGVISSTIFSFFAIRFLLDYLKKSNFSVFVWYRIILAIMIFGIYLYR